MQEITFNEAIDSLLEKLRMKTRIKGGFDYHKNYPPVRCVSFFSLPPVFFPYIFFSMSGTRHRGGDLIFRACILYSERKTSPGLIMREFTARHQDHKPGESRRETG